MKALIVSISVTLAHVLFAAGPPKPSTIHFIEPARVSTNAPSAYRVAVAYDRTRREPLRYDYGMPLTRNWK
jgi:hypothetical protein